MKLPLHFIVLSIGVLVLQLLLTGCANTSRMHRAAFDGDTEELRRMLERSPHEINRIRGATDLYYGTPLNLAIINGHKDTVQVLIELGADVNARSVPNYVFPCNPVLLEVRFRESTITHHRRGPEKVTPGRAPHTPIMFAAIYEQPDIIDLLVENGAQVNAKIQNRALWNMPDWVREQGSDQWDGASAITIALALQKWKAADALIDNGSRFDVKLSASAEPGYADLQTLITYNALKYQDAIEDSVRSQMYMERWRRMGVFESFSSVLPVAPDVATFTMNGKPVASFVVRDKTFLGR